MHLLETKTVPKMHEKYLKQNTSLNINKTKQISA